MILQKLHKIVTDKGGKVLEHRTTMKGFNIGDTFSFQSLKVPYTIMFFFKDKVFDHCPMVFGLDERTGETIMVSSKLLTIIRSNEILIKRTRGK